jgi:hypothetical protein
VLDLPGRLLSNTLLTAVKPCLDKECLVRDYLVKECLLMVCLARAMVRCQEAQVGMAVARRLKLVDGIRVNLLKATATDTKATRARQLGLWERPIQRCFLMGTAESYSSRRGGGWAGPERKPNATLII